MRSTGIAKSIHFREASRWVLQTTWSQTLYRQRLPAQGSFEQVLEHFVCQERFFSRKTVNDYEADLWKQVGWHNFVKEVSLLPGF
jgi:hypothetical protein